MTESNNRLRPCETVQKVLISTTSRMVGHYENKSIVITQAFPSFYDRSAIFRTLATPFSRSGLMVAFETPPVEEGAGIVGSDYIYTGETVCAYMSVLFGKRFDYHGPVEANGHYEIPDTTAYSRICDPRLPFNSHEPRNCFPVPLEINQVSSIEKVLFRASGVDEKLRHRLEVICKFYMRALQNAEHDPETGYLNLITAGEILSNFFQYSEEEMFDEGTLRDLDLIRSEIKEGDKIAKRISSRFTSVKKAFVESLCSLLDDSFYSKKEFMRRFVPEDIDKNIGAAYDLRSNYVHSGVSFGRWMDFSGNHSDLRFGKPMIDDSKLAKILEKAPRFIGFERLMRYCILKFMSSQGVLAVTSK